MSFCCARQGNRQPFAPVLENFSRSTGALLQRSFSGRIQAMSAIGYKRTFSVRASMSAIGGKADITNGTNNVRL
jgi:hypothetical protein